MKKIFKFFSLIFINIVTVSLSHLLLKFSKEVLLFLMTNVLWFACFCHFNLFCDIYKWNKLWARLCLSEKNCKQKALETFNNFFKISDVGKIGLYIFYEKYNLKVVVLVGNYDRDRNTKKPFYNIERKGDAKSYHYKYYI